jgi:hypothetical protein
LQPGFVKHGEHCFNLGIFTTGVEKYIYLYVIPETMVVYPVRTGTAHPRYTLGRL